MNLRQAKQYLCKNKKAELLVVPRRHSYVLQIRDAGKLENIRKNYSMQTITCDTLEQVNEYARKLNKIDYNLVQNCPHVEMGGFDTESQKIQQREDLTVVNLR